MALTYSMFLLHVLLSLECPTRVSDLLFKGLPESAVQTLIKELMGCMLVLQGGRHPVRPDVRLQNLGSRTLTGKSTCCRICCLGR